MRVAEYHHFRFFFFYLAFQQVEIHFHGVACVDERVFHRYPSVAFNKVLERMIYRLLNQHFVAF